MERKINSWLDGVAAVYHGSAASVRSLRHLHRLVAAMGADIPSPPWVMTHDLSDRLPVAIRYWYGSLNSQQRTRFPAWKRALLDIHYWMVLIEQGVGPIKFVVHHADLYAEKIASTGIRNRSQMEYLERRRIIANPFWNELTTWGYPPLGEMVEKDTTPVCVGRCEFLWHMTHEVGDVELSIVATARDILDYSVGPLFEWLPVRTRLVQSDAKYHEAIAAYLGLEVDYVYHKS